MTPDPPTPDASSELSPAKRALLELRAMRAKLDALERARAEPIAIVGMACRFPGADGPDALWRLVGDGVDAVREVPADRWDVERYHDADVTAPGKMTTRWGGFIDGIDHFDPRFFGISPREAMAMDPQQRLLLEVGWEALEHAAQSPDRLAGTAAGVFVGISSFDYVHLAMGAPEAQLDSHLAQGIAHSAASGRLAYVLGLQGPAISLDTACSSSLLAVHLAVQSLRRGECRLALAGGVNAILLPTFLIGFSKSQMMAADGRCKTFDARADGFVRGEGCGVVVLKRLADAIADRDRVWAVIRGTAANQDGRSSGMTAPNGVAQEAVVRAALADAGIEPRLVGYVETHGTGTALGDPIEVQALGAALGDDRAAAEPLRIGSIKTNVGHLEAAAGVAGVMKAALALRHGEIPLSLHFQQPNPLIPWAEIPVEVAAERRPFAPIEGRRIAGVSSFGFTGTNVHVVLEAFAAAPITPATDGPVDRDVVQAPLAARADRRLHLLKLGARDPVALDALVGRWIEFLEETREPFGDVCFSSTVGRADLRERLAVTAGSAAEAREALAAHARGREAPGLARGSADTTSAQLAFLFTGHGAQYAGMGRSLYETQPTFRAALDECDRLLRSYLERSLLSVLFPAEVDADSPLLTGMTYSQPALFALQYALVELWRSWGVEPAMVLGHSVGEYAAAVAAGVFSLEDGLKLVAARGRLMDSIAVRGAMLAVFAGVAEVEALIAPHAGRVSIAAVNGPAEVVVSGEAEAVEAIAAALEARGAEFRQLAVAQAGHSHLLDPILDDFEAVAATVHFSAPRLPLVSCTTGAPLCAAEAADPGYWRRHLREPVRFDRGLETLRRDGCTAFLEIGPNSNLVGMGRRCLPDEPELLWTPSLRRDQDDWRQLLESLAALHVRGVAVDWEGFERDHLDAPGAERRRVPLPTYAWRHAAYWLEHAPRGGASPAIDRPAAWERVVDAARRQELQGPLDLALDSFPTRWRALDRLTTGVVAATLAELGAFRAAEPTRSADLIDVLGILPKYERLVARWLARLERAGLLRPESGGRYVVDEPLSAAPLELAWGEAERALADWGFMLDYLRRCAGLLPSVLVGRVNPLETIFPDGDFGTADALYRDSVMPRYYNAVAGAAADGLIAALPGTLRVLEIGGGTGGTTATLAPRIAAAGGTYHFTDVSDLFLARAAERYGELPGVGFGLLDIDQDPLAQGYAPGTFDLVVAANVLHAIHDVRQALERVRTLLAPGGVLLLVEVTAYLDWFDISTALLEGWDLQADGLRGEHPMLAVGAWEGAMREAGFVEFAAFPTSGSPAEVMAQHVLVAQVPLAPAGSETPRAVEGASGTRPPSRSPEILAPEDAIAAQLAAASQQVREELLVEYVRGHIAALLRLDSPRSVDRGGRLMDLGLDSLMAVELRGRLSRGLPLTEPLPATLIFDHPTVESIVRLISGLLEASPAAPVSTIEVPAVVGPPADAELDALSDDEVEARLMARLERIEGRIR